MIIFGIDVGASGIKGAPVDTELGKLTSERLRLTTPQPATPEAMTDVIAQLTSHFEWKDRVGVGFPSVIRDGVMLTAANIAKNWIGLDGKALIQHKTGCDVTLLNDADAAGLAEMKFGAGRGVNGLVMVITLGTGIGSALFIDGHLVPNTELGHIEIRGKEAERRASDRVRQERELSWDKWAARVDEYLLTMEHLFWPKLIIIGGGVSKSFDRFSPYLSIKAECVPAQLQNDAGIIGAALAAQS